MIIALAGRRIDAVDATQVRFPLSRSATVRDRIRATLMNREASALVGSAACGADLLALDVATELGLRRRVVLPFSPQRFRETSVVDRPGDWGVLFDALIHNVTQSGDLAVLGDKEGDDVYAAVNEAILDEAQKLSRSSGESGVLAVIVWDGGSRGAGDLTEAFAISARARGIEVAEVLTV